MCSGYGSILWKPIFLLKGSDQELDRAKYSLDWRSSWTTHLNARFVFGSGKVKAMKAVGFLRVQCQNRTPHGK